MNTCRNALAIFLVLPFAIANAKCLPRSDAANKCRYVEGDSWCGVQDKSRPYAYSDSCLEASVKHRNNESTADVSRLTGLRQNMNYSEARQIILNAGWQGNGTRWQDIPEHGQERDIYDNNGWKEVVSCAGTGSAPCRFEFTDIHGNQLVVITEGECLNEKSEELKQGETCDLPVSRWFLE